MLTAAIMTNGEQNGVGRRKPSEGIRCHDVPNDRLDASRLQEGNPFYKTGYSDYCSSVRDPEVRGAKAEIAATNDQLPHTISLITSENARSATGEPGPTE
jgi:hypothetical protein